MRMLSLVCCAVLMTGVAASGEQFCGCLHVQSACSWLAVKGRAPFVVNMPSNINSCAPNLVTCVEGSFTPYWESVPFGCEVRDNYPFYARSRECRKTSRVCS
jgi:hypothetical protein